MIIYIKSIIYGIIQGLTEFLPVSSSGHLAAFQILFGKVDENLNTTTYTLLLHVGTLAAVLLVYRKDVLELIKSMASVFAKLFTGKFKFSKLDEGEKFFCLLFMALLPLALGALVDGYVEVLSNYIICVGILWLINGLIFLFAESKKIDEISFEKITPLKALRVGLFQLFAILPGISRSGMTIIGGTLHGFKREFAVKFSFILSIPAILGSTAITLLKDYDKLAFDNMGVILAGVAAAFVSGLCAIKLLEYISNKHNFKVFAYYCFAIGFAAVAYAAGHLIVTGTIL